MQPPDFLPSTESNSVSKGLTALQRDQLNSLYAKDLPNATIQPFKMWQPLRMKTGLRNHRIGRKMSLT